MDNILYVIAITLVIFWAIGLFIYDAGEVIHLLLVLAAISVLLRVLRKS
jgi:hypothetical protein